MALPTVLLVLARNFPQLGLGERRAPVAEACELYRSSAISGASSCFMPTTW